MSVTDSGPRTAQATEPPAAADPVVSAWRAIAASYHAVTCALEQELAESVHLSQSALSRMIGRLEQHGLVERSLCDNDRRGIYVCLTDAGRRRHAEALPTQRAVLAATLQSGRATGH